MKTTKEERTAARTAARVDLRTKSLSTTLNEDLLDDLDEALASAEAERARSAALQVALDAIANHPHNTKADGGPDSYSMGVQDGHRCAASIARSALSQPAPEEKKP